MIKLGPNGPEDKDTGTVSPADSGTDTGLFVGLCGAATLERARDDLVEAIADAQKGRTRQSVGRTRAALAVVFYECCSHLQSRGILDARIRPGDLSKLEYVDLVRFLERLVLTPRERSDFNHYNDVFDATKGGSGIDPHPKEAKGFAAAALRFGLRLGLWASIEVEPPGDVSLTDRDGHLVLNLAALEREAIKTAMRICGGNQTKAAGLLGIHRDTLRRKLAEHGM
jgi:Fis family transcriptional regulator